MQNYYPPQSWYDALDARIKSLSRGLEVREVDKRPPPAAPDQAEAFAIGPQGVPEIDWDSIAMHAEHIDVERVPGEVPAVEGSAAAGSDQSSLFVRVPAAAGDDERYADLARRVDQIYCLVADLRDELEQMARSRVARQRSLF